MTIRSFLNRLRVDNVTGCKSTLAAIMADVLQNLIAEKEIMIIALEIHMVSMGGHMTHFFPIIFSLSISDTYPHLCMDNFRLF